jgi:hypothetical protein
MAGFEVITHGRFWAIAEAVDYYDGRLTKTAPPTVDMATAPERRARRGKKINAAESGHTGKPRARRPTAYLDVLFALWEALITSRGSRCALAEGLREVAGD